MAPECREATLEDGYDTKPADVFALGLTILVALYVQKHGPARQPFLAVITKAYGPSVVHSKEGEEGGNIATETTIDDALGHAPPALGPLYLGLLIKCMRKQPTVRCTSSYVFETLDACGPDPPAPLLPFYANT
jgi:hypothetical protein